jgi:hypothetical protein
MKAAKLICEARRVKEAAPVPEAMRRPSMWRHRRLAMLLPRERPARVASATRYERSALARSWARS